MTVLYLAGPMRGREAFNFPEFFDVEKRLAGAGYTVINPARHDRDNGFDPTGMSGGEDLAATGFDLRSALAWDLRQVCLHADGVALLPGWGASEGAKVEVSVARVLGLPARLWTSWRGIA